MPGHIFARLGLWQEDIQSNLASKAAAEKPGAGTENRLHAMEFLEYAYLQLGQDDEAANIVAEGQTVKASDLEPRYANYYATVENRFRALYAIETHDWMQAAHLEATSSEEETGRWVILLAHAMAAGHLKDRTLAESALRESEEWTKKQIKDKPMPKSGTREAGFLDRIEAWRQFTVGDIDAAVRLLSPIADREAKEGKGEVDLPIRESLAEMLLLSGRPKDALKQYQRSLKTDPNRFNALLGAGRAAEQTGRAALAREYYRQLLSNCSKAQGPAVAELAHPKSFVRNERK
jgi:tetratricopeptide (TPR) repeat protein